MDFRLTSDLIQIAASGGGFRLEAGNKLTSDLIQIAAAANRSGATVIFSQMSSRLTSDLIQIGAAGKGAVIFEN